METLHGLGGAGFYAQAEQTLHEQPPQVCFHVEYGAAVGPCPPASEASEEIYGDTGRHRHEEGEETEEETVLVGQAEEGGGHADTLKAYVSRIFTDDRASGQLEDSHFEVARRCPGLQRHRDVEHAAAAFLVREMDRPGHDAVEALMLLEMYEMAQHQAPVHPRPLDIHPGLDRLVTELEAGPHLRGGRRFQGGRRVHRVETGRVQEGHMLDPSPYDASDLAAAIEYVVFRRPLYPDHHL